MEGEAFRTEEPNGRGMNDFLYLDRRGAFAICAICAGVLSLVLFLFPVVYSPRAPVELLPFFESHRSSYILLAITILSWVMVAIPFVVAVGAMLSTRSRSWALAATLLSTGGILLLGFAVFAFVGALLAIVASAGAAPNAAAATYQAAIWSNLSFFHPKWVAGPSNLVAFTILFGLRVRAAEKMMADEFGDEYTAYMARGKRLVPGVW